MDECVGEEIDVSEIVKEKLIIRIKENSGVYKDRDKIIFKRKSAENYNF